MDKTVSLSVKLGLDSQQFNDKVNRIAKDFKPIEVAVNFKPKSTSASFSASGDKGKINIEASIQKGISQPLKELAKSFGVELEKSAKKQKPSALSGLIGNIIAPFKTLVTGAVEGIGRELSSNLGKGVSTSLEKQFSGIIGSTELFGERLTDTAFNALKSSEQLKKVVTLLNREFVTGKDSTVNPIEQLKKARDSLKNIVGEANLIVEQNSAALVAMQKQTQKLYDARENLARQVETFFASESSRETQVGTISDSVAIAQEEKARQLLIAKALEAELAQRNQALKVRKDELKRQSNNSLSEDELSEKVILEDQKLVDARRKQVKNITKSIVQKKIDKGEELTEDTFANARLEAEASVSGDSQSVAELEIELYQTVASLTNLTRTIIVAENKIKQLRNPVAGATEQLETITPGFKEERVRLQTGLSVLQEEDNQQISRFDEVIKKRGQDVANVDAFSDARQEQFVTESLDLKAKRSQAQTAEEIADIDQKLLALETKANADLVKIAQLRNKAVASLKESEKAREDFIAQSPQARANIESKALTNLQQRFVNSVRANAAANAPQVKVGGQSTLPAAPPAVATVKEAKLLQTERKANLKIYEEIVKKVAELSGGKISANDIPELVVNNDLITQRNMAGFIKSQNQVALNETDYKDLAEGQVTKELVNIIAHELRHALQFEFGRNRSGDSVDLLTPTEQEQEKTKNVIPNSVRLARQQNPGITPEELEVVKKTEVDAYTFAERYQNEILQFVESLQLDKQPVNPKLSEAQKTFASQRKAQQKQLIDSLAEENKNNLQQLNKAQLTQIAKSASLKGYSTKKVGELREMLLKEVAPDDLSFRIPTFSKVDSTVQEEAQNLLKLRPEVLKSETRDFNKFISDSTKTAGKTGDSAALREALNYIDQARKTYAAALAESVDQETKNVLNAALATLGKQRVAAQSRLSNIDNKKFNSVSTNASVTPSQGVSDVAFGFAGDVGVELELNKLRKSLQARAKVISGEKEVDTSAIDKLAKRLLESNENIDEEVAKLIKKIVADVEGQIITVDVALRKVTKITQTIDKNLEATNQKIINDANASFKKAQAALKQIEENTNKEVSRIDNRRKASATADNQKLNRNLAQQGIYSSEPLQVQQQQEQSVGFRPVRAAKKVVSEFRDFRSNSIKKQSEVLNQQAAAVLIDLEAQIASAKAASIEAKAIKKAIADNEKQLREILKTAKDAKEGKTKLTPGDLQRLSGQADQLSDLITADNTRLADLNSRVEAGRNVAGVRQNLRDSTTQSSRISQQGVLSAEEAKKVNELNTATRESLKLLGQDLPQDNFFSKLNAQLPEVAQNAIKLVQGLFAISSIKFVADILKDIGQQAFQTSIQFQALENNLKFVSGGDADINLDFVKKLSDDLAFSLDISIDGFTKLTASARSTSLEGAKTREIYKSLAVASRVLGLTNEQLDGALLATSQIMSKGTVQSEELRGQLGERLPGAFQIAARAMNVTTAELSKMLERGEVLSEDFLPKFAAQLEKETSGGLAGAANTGAASMQRLNNEMTLVRKEIGDAIAPAIVTSVNIISNSFKFLRENSTLVKTAIIGLSSVILVSLIPSIAAAAAMITTIATVAIPLLAKAFLAIVVANPLLVAGIIAMTAAFMAAQPAAEGLANALNGVTQAQLDLVDQDISFDAKFNQALTKLIGQVPLAQEEIEALNVGLDDQASRGVRSASAVQKFKDQLLRLQGVALATAEAQKKLTESLKASEKAFEDSRNAIGIEDLQKQLSIAQSAAKGAFGADKLADATYQQQSQQNLALSQALQTRISIIKENLAESKRLQDAGKKGIEAKEEIELSKELENLEKEALQTRISQANIETSRMKDLRERDKNHYSQLLEIGKNYQEAGIISEVTAAQKTLQIQQEFADVRLADIKAQRDALSKEDKAGLLSLKVQETQILNEIATARKNVFEKQLNDSKQYQTISNRIFAAAVTQGKGNLEQQAMGELQATRRTVDEQVKLIQKRLKELPSGSQNQKLELIAQQEELFASIAKGEEDLLSKRITLNSQQSSRLSNIQKSLLDQSIIDQATYSEITNGIKVQEFQKELSLIRERQAALSESNTQGQQELEEKEYEALAKISNVRKEAFEKQLSLTQKVAKDELSVLEGSQISGLISVTEFNQKRLEQTVTALDKELVIIADRRRQINSKNVEAQRELQVLEADIYKRRLDAQKQFLDAQIGEIERQQSKARDLTELSAKQREIEQEKLFQKGLLSDTQVEKTKLDATQARLKQEIKFEQDAIALINKTRNFGNAELERDRATRMRASQLKTADLQLQLLQSERQQQEALIKSIERVIAAINNKGRAAELELGKELRLNDSLNKSLEFQSKILTAQKSLLSAKASFIETDFRILQESAETEREKQELGQIAADAKLQAVKQQVELDKQSLELQIQQTAAAQTRLEVENAIALTKNRAAIAVARAEEASLGVKPGATPEEKEAARLTTEAALMEREGLLDIRGTLSQQRGLNARIADTERTAFGFESGAKINSAELEAANAIVDKSDKREKLEKLRNDAQRRRFGVSQDDDFVAFSQAKEAYERSEAGYYTTPLQDYLAANVRKNMSVTPTAIEVPKVQPLETFNKSADKFDGAVDKLVDLVTSRLKAPVEQNNQINNYYQPGQNTTVKDLSSEITKGLYDLGIELNKR